MACIGLHGLQAWLASPGPVITNVTVVLAHISQIVSMAIGINPKGCSRSYIPKSLPEGVIVDGRLEGNNTLVLCGHNEPLY